MKYWHSYDKPREKLLEQGADTLSDSELIAVLLNTGHKGADALQVANQLLIKAGSLRHLLNASSERLCAQRGIGQVKYARLMASVELGRRYLGRFPRRGMQLGDPSEVKAMLSSRLRDRPSESFVALFLDNRQRLLHYEEMFHGTVDSANVHPREVVRKAMGCNASAIIIAHNHPSGISEPSMADQRLTDRLRAALELVGVKLLDHFIIAEEEILSFTEKGLL